MFYLTGDINAMEYRGEITGLLPFRRVRLAPASPSRGGPEA